MSSNPDQNPTSSDASPSSTVTLSHLPIPSDDPAHFVHIIHNLLSPEECQELIESHTDLLPSNITLGTIRERELFNDSMLARRLWHRMGKFYEGYKIKDENGHEWVAKRLNPGMRLSRYEKGGKFTAHFDFPRRINMNEYTFLSVNIYLNTIDPSHGGSTRVLRHEPGDYDYWDGEENLDLKVVAKIQPVRGTASVFRDALWHDGEELLSGEKYLLRTDVVFERVGLLDLDDL